MRRLAPALVLSLSLLACGGDDDDSDDGDDGVPPGKVCLDVASAFARLCSDCAIDTYENCFASYVSTQTNGGDCTDVTGIRDRASLYNVCIPWVNERICQDIETVPVDSSCKDQLLTN